MKRFVIVASLFLIVSLSAFSQGLYFDIGIGLGSATTKIDGQDLSALFGPTVDDFAADIGMKLGYGPVAGIPLYIVGEFGGVGHRFSDGVNYIQFNSYLIGPGLIVYPVPFIQLGGSVGYSFVANQSDFPNDMYESTNGIAANAYFAVDLGKRNHGCLIGVKYFKATNTLEISAAEQETSMMSIFIKYAFRHKVR